MEETSPNLKKRQLEEDHTPLWIKIFGSSVLSILFLCVVTLTGYIVNNLNSLQTQLNILNADTVTKKDFTVQFKTVWDGIKLDSDNVVSIKERINAAEQVSKDRQIWADKCEAKLVEQAKGIELSNKDSAGQKERINNIETQLTQFREENRQLQKDLQLLRERVASIEAKSGEKKKE